MSFFDEIKNRQATPTPSASAFDLIKNRNVSDVIQENTIQKDKYAVLKNKVQSPVEQGKNIIGAFGSSLKENLSGLGTLYGGSEQGIASKLGRNIQEAANDMQKGNIATGIAKAGFRTAGDVAGTIYAPIGAAIGTVTGGINKLFPSLGKKYDESINYVADRIAENPEVQKFAVSYPEAGEDFGRALNLLMATADKGKIEPKRMLKETKQSANTIKTKTGDIIKKNTPDIFTKSAEQMRSEKITSGLKEQNTRLITADKSFKENTKIYTDEAGNKTTVTPIDTFAKYKIAPQVEKGTIRMGDYKTGDGELGKIKTEVKNFDNQIDTKLVNTGKQIKLSDFQKATEKQVMQNSDLIRSGKVAKTIKQIESRFEDYKNSYGDSLDIAEINNIRKVANKDWSLDTQDVSKMVGNSARDIVYNATDDLIVKDLLRKQGELLSAKNYAEKINGTKVTGGRLGNYAMRTGGAIIGATVKGFPVAGPIAGMLGGEALARLMQQSQFRSLGAETKALFQGLLKKEWQKKVSELQDYQKPFDTILKSKNQSLPKSALPSQIANKTPNISINIEIKNELKKLIKDEASIMESQIGGVSLVGERGGQLKRASNNPLWYREFYKENGRVPGKNDMLNLAEKELEQGSGMLSQEYQGIKTVLNDINTSSSSSQSTTGGNGAPFTNSMSKTSSTGANKLTPEAKDIASEMSSRGINLNPDNTITVYHRTTPANKLNIEKTGVMAGQEDGIFFSTKKTGQAEGFGTAVIELKIPLNKLELDDIFKDEAHLKLPSIKGKPVNINNFSTGATKLSGNEAIKSQLSENALIKEAKKYKTAEEFVKEQGETLYHGTPAKFETKDFKGGYLTADKKYADIYQSKSASSISYGSEGVKNKASGEPRTLEFVLPKNAKLFDNTKLADRKLLNDYWGKSSMSREYSPTKTGQLDWTEGENLAEYLREKGYKFDGIKLDEAGGFDPISGMEVKRHPSVLILNPDILKTKSQLTDIWNKANK